MSEDAGIRPKRLQEVDRRRERDKGGRASCLWDSCIIHAPCHISSGDLYTKMLATTLPLSASMCFLAMDACDNTSQRDQLLLWGNSD